VIASVYCLTLTQQAFDRHATVPSDAVQPGAVKFTTTVDI